MPKKMKALRLRQIETVLSSFRQLQRSALPKKGWIREIREALHMTARQLGERIGVSQPAISQFEESEVDGTITLNSLRKVARGLGAELVYVLVPHESLEETLQTQIRRVARERLERIRHTMSLEDQVVSEGESEKNFEELVAQLTEKPPQNLWI